MDAIDLELRESVMEDLRLFTNHFLCDPESQPKIEATPEGMRYITNDNLGGTVIYNGLTVIEDDDAGFIRVTGKRRNSYNPGIKVFKIEKRKYKI